jgi:tape measure domain-containing protein
MEGGNPQMSLAVEDRIVAMKFDNKQFDPAVKSTMSILDKLKEKLNFTGANKGLSNLQSSANRFSLANIGRAVSDVGSRFGAMSVAAITAIASIVHRAVDAGLRIGNAFTIKPLQQGFQEYETQLGSVQTILANTAASGATLKDVNATLDQLNEYSDKTIYNFGQMAKNIGTFTAAGVDLDTATSSIKGIANLAALSGSNSEQASTAMYQLSQAISSGRVSLQDWNSVVNAGMGGTVFQRALAQTAERMGTLDKGAVKLTGKMKNVSIQGKSFRESITAKPGEQSWLTSDVLTKTLQQFTGDMTDAELATMGFNEAQIKSIQEQAKTAQDAATQVKTFTQLIGTLQESAGSGWAQTFEILLGDFEEAKKLWTNVNNILGGFISKSADARNKMLQDWKDLGGRTKLIQAVSNIFDALVAVVKPIREAFREIFPAATGKQLYNLTVALLNFTKNLKIGGQTATDLRRTFAGFFAILSIGVSIVKGIFRVLGRLFGFASQGAGSFLSVTASIGDFLVRLDQTIKKGDLVNKFFDALGFFISLPLGALVALTKALVEFMRNLDADPLEILSKHFGRLRERLAPLAAAAEWVSRAWDSLVKVFKRVVDFLQPAIDAVKKAFNGIWDAIAKAFEAGNFTSVFDALNTGLLTGIVLLIKKFFDQGLKIDFGGGFAQGIRDTFGALTDTLTAMQNNIQAKTLLLIAGAIALLTASVVALSLIDSDKLTKALTAMSVAFGQLLAAMAVLTKISGAAGFLKVPMIAAALVLLAGAVLILSAAVKVLSTMDWEELAKGLTGVAAILAMLVLASVGLQGASAGILRAGLAMVPLAIGIRILASAVKSFATLSWGKMAKGLTALAGSMVIIAGAMQLMPPHMILQAAGLVILSVALNGIGLALRNMGGMKWGEIAKALVALAGSLVILAAGLYLMTGTLPGAAALLVAAGSMMVLAPVLILFGKMSWKEIGKGLVTLAGALVVMAGGLYLMTGTIAGSAALLVAAGALAVLAPVLVVLGAMSWTMIAKGLVAIAGAFTVLGLAGLILTPLVPVILALSAAMLILGAGFSLIGVGAIAVATAFSIFAAAGTAGVAVLLAMINLIPQLMIKFAEGIIGFATTLASQADKFVLAFASLLNSMLDAVNLILPKLAVTINLLIQNILRLLITNAPLINEAGFKLFLAFLTGLERNIPAITTAVANIIVSMMRALQAKMPELTTAGADLLVALLNGIAANIGKVVQAGGTIVVKYIEGASNNLGRVVEAGGKLVLNYIKGISNNLQKIIAAGGNLVVNFFNGITRQIPRIAKAGTNTVLALIRAIGDSSQRLLDAGARLIIRLVNGLARTIRQHNGEMRDAGWNLASAIISGMTGGISDRVGHLADMAAWAARRAIWAAKNALGIASPSKEFVAIGRYSTEGFALGFANYSGLAEKAAEGVATDALNAVRESMSGMSEALSGSVDFDPVIRPVLDLTNITRDAAKIGGMLDQNSLAANVSYGQAASISNNQQTAEDAADDSATAGGDTKIFKFEQINNSPKALSAAEIYRNTRNQLALAKEALGV